VLCPPLDSAPIHGQQAVSRCDLPRCAVSLLNLATTAQISTAAPMRPSRAEASKKLANGPALTTAVR
jgi:hypothetical protein